MDNQQKTITQNDLGWLGGIIDGEGTVTVNRRDAKNQGTTWMPKVSITNTDPNIIAEAVRICKALDLPTYIQTKEYSVKGERRFKIELVWQGFKRVNRVLPLIIPHLRGKKKKKAEHMAKWITYRLSLPRRSKYTDVDTAYLLQIRESGV